MYARPIALWSISFEFLVNFLSTQSIYQWEWGSRYPTVAMLEIFAPSNPEKIDAPTLGTFTANR